MGNERVIFSNRFDRPTLEQIEEEMKNKNYDDNENLMSADEFLEFMKQNRRTVPNEKRIQRVRGAVHGFHGISTAGVNMVEVCIPLSDNRFPYQHLRSHHVRHFVSIGFILRAPVEGQVTLIAILHDSAQQCLDGIGINCAVAIRWIVLPIILAVSCIGFLQQTGNPRLNAVAGRAIEGTDGVQCGHPCCLTGGPAVHIMQLIMPPSAAVIEVGIPASRKTNGIGFCHLAGRGSGKGGDTAAENGCEADQQRHKP